MVDAIVHFYKRFYAVVIVRGVNPGGRESDFGPVVVGSQRESRTGHEILLHLIMYRKYVQKW